MAGHIFINRLKCIVRDKTMIFWTLIFPMALALFFNMAFGNIASGENFRAFPIAVVDNNEYRSELGFAEALRSVSDDNPKAQTKLFHVTVMSQADAKNSLKNGNIVGYIMLDNEAHVFVKKTGIQQTILKSFTDSYLQTSSAYRKVITENPDQARNIIANVQKDYLKNMQPNGKPAVTTIVNFFALLSMAVLFGGFFGKNEIDAIQADLSSQGARINLSPVPKMKSFACSMSAALVVQFLALAILVAFLGLVLKVDFGGQLGYVLIVCLIGSMTGISYGAFIGSLFKGGKGTAVLISVSMLLSSAAGLQAPILKYYIAEKVPVLAYLNPANLITDAFYSLYYYTTYTRFYINIALLGAFTILFFATVIIVIKKQKFNSVV